MSDSRRSSRAKKAVDYAAFGERDDDDDFADPTPPPKKSKSANKENKPSRKKVVAENSERAKERTPKERKSCNRQSLDEKLFDRDLEAAMKLSLQSSEAGDGVTEVTIQTHAETEVTPALGSSTKSTAESSGSSNTTKRLLASAAEDDNEIIELPSEDTNPSKRRKAATKRVAYEEEEDSDGGGHEEQWVPGEEASPDSASEDDDDDDEFDPDDSDSDYESSRKRKNKKPTKPKPVAKKTPAKTKTKTPATVTPVNKARTSGVKAGTTKSACRSAPSTPSYSTPIRTGGATLKRAWVPPARGGSMSSPLSAVSVKSPSSGLRLGLSRNQKVKSLHPSVTCS